MAFWYSRQCQHVLKLTSMSKSISGRKSQKHIERYKETPPSKERFYQVLQFKNNQHLFQQNKHTQTNYTKQHPIATNHLTLPETKLAPEKNGIPQKKRIVFQPSIFRGLIMFVSGRVITSRTLHSSIPNNICRKTSKRLKSELDSFPAFTATCKKWSRQTWETRKTLEQTRILCILYTLYQVSIT